MGTPQPRQAEDRTTESSGLLGRVPLGHLGPGVPLRLRAGLPRSKGLDGFHWGPTDTLACSALLQKRRKDVGSRNKTIVSTTAKVEAVDNDCYACLLSVPSPHDRAKWRLLPVMHWRTLEAQSTSVTCLRSHSLAMGVGVGSALSPIPDPAADTEPKPCNSMSQKGLEFQPPRCHQPLCLSSPLTGRASSCRMRGLAGAGAGWGGVYLSLLCCFLPRPGCPADTPIYVKSQWLPQPGQPSLEPTPPHPSVPEGTTPYPSSGPPATTALFPGRMPSPWDLATFCVSPHSLGAPAGWGDLVCLSQVPRCLPGPPLLPDLSGTVRL